MGESKQTFRGCEDLVYAHILKDNNTDGENEGYVTGPVLPLAGLGSVGKTTEVASGTTYFDNAPADTIQSEGSDEVTLLTAVVDLKTLGDILGKGVDEATGAFMDGPADPPYVAVGYKLGLSDGTKRLVWRLKGKFGIPDESAETINDGTDTQSQELKYTGVATTHEFAKPKAQGKSGKQKALVVDERDGLADTSKFFDEVTTIDTLPAKSASPGA
ncbi:major tail protein [Anaerofustis stercorihominis]|uniref:major tail protein n=1 Tax=Anaerofustis stercorihominis TaxID=214853 RepID=UPI002672C48A|nr:major tail protein [Anaerofustis stercorihominis]